MMHECISTVSTSVLLNGSPGEVFFFLQGVLDWETPCHLICLSLS